MRPQRWKTRAAIAASLWLLLLAGPLPLARGAEDGGDTWFDLSDFNPLGKLFDPIERAIPHLTIKGMLRQQTRFPLQSDDNSDSQDLAQGIVGRKRHWDFDNIEWLGELELRYQPTPSLELVNIWNMQYDAIYDWDHWWRQGDKGTIRVFPDGRKRSVHPNRWIEREMEYYHSSKRYLRELYLNWTQGPFNLVLGKQQQVWGKIDFALIDVLNPVDRRMGNIYGLLDAKWRRIPLWMGTFRYLFGDGRYYLQLTWDPDFEQDPGLPQGYPYDVTRNPALPPFGAGRRVDQGGVVSIRLKDNQPSEAFRNHQWYLRFGYNWQGFDGFLFYACQWNPVAALFRRNAAVTRQQIFVPQTGKFRDPKGDAVHVTGDVDIFLEPEHTRLHRLGATFDKTVYFWRRDWLFIYEGMATFNQYFPVSDLSRFDPKTGNRLPGAKGFTSRSPETLNFLKGVRSSQSDGLAKRNWMLNALQVDTHALRGHLVISGIYTNNVIFGRDGHIFFPARNHGSLSTFSLNLNYWPGRWEGRWWLRYGLRLTPEQGSYRMNFRTDYTFSSYLKTTLNLWLWDGNQNDGPDGLFRDRDLVDLRFEDNF